jgi:hypothetical protein
MSGASPPSALRLRLMHRALAMMLLAPIFVWLQQFLSTMLTAIAVVSFLF